MSLKIQSDQSTAKRSSSSRSKGQYFEDLALSFLENRGHKLIQKNFRTQFGEIDLIVQDAQFIVFVEVKYRTTLAYGHPAESINKQKIKRIRQAASCFFQQHLFQQRKHHKTPRFDVIGIVPSTAQAQTNAQAAEPRKPNDSKTMTHASLSYEFDWIKEAF